MMWFKKKKQNTYCYCPVCHQDLVGTNSFVKDIDNVYYRCSRCGCQSVWDFDSPVPLLLKHQRLTKELL